MPVPRPFSRRDFALRSLAAVLLAGALTGTATPTRADDAAEAQRIVDSARIAFDSMMGDAQFPAMKDLLREARAVIVFPQVLKAGFILGGSGGTGVLLVRDDATGEWSQPAFYTVGSVTFGLQIGGEVAEVVMLAMNEKAVQTLYASSVKLGGDFSIAAGPKGGGQKQAIISDFVSFAKSRGAYAGINLEGSVLDVRDSVNRAYYGQSVTPVDIIVKKAVSSPGADALRAAVAAAAMP